MRHRVLSTNRLRTQARERLGLDESVLTWLLSAERLSLGPSAVTWVFGVLGGGMCALAGLVVSGRGVCADGEDVIGS